MVVKRNMQILINILGCLTLAYIAFAALFGLYFVFLILKGEPPHFSIRVIDDDYAESEDRWYVMKNILLWSFCVGLIWPLVRVEDERGSDNSRSP